MYTGIGTEVREGGDESALLGLEPGLLEAEGEKGGPLEDTERGARRGMAVLDVEQEAGEGGSGCAEPRRCDIEGRVEGESNVA